MSKAVTRYNACELPVNTIVVWRLCLLCEEMRGGTEVSVKIDVISKVEAHNL